MPIACHTCFVCSKTKSSSQMEGHQMTRCGVVLWSEAGTGRQRMLSQLNPGRLPLRDAVIFCVYTAPQDSIGHTTRHWLNNPFLSPVLLISFTAIRGYWGKRDTYNISHFMTVQLYKQVGKQKEASQTVSGLCLCLRKVLNFFIKIYIFFFFFFFKEWFLSVTWLILLFVRFVKLACTHTSKSTPRQPSMISIIFSRLHDNTPFLHLVLH